MIAAKTLTPHIGAQVTGIDLSGPIDEKTQTELKRLWLEHVILVFRGQKLDQEALLRVTGYFGTPAKLARPKAFHPVGYGRLLEGIMLISNVREGGVAIGSLPDGEMMFHHDMIHAANPDKGTCLYAVDIPSVGGNTLFANCATAYDLMPRDLRDRLEGRRAFHHYNYGETQRHGKNGIEAFSESSHPVFRTHEETGRKAVYVNRLMTEQIVDMPKSESDDLLARVFDHSENPEWIYEHVWQPDDLVIWDNRCSMHARTDFPAGERRLLLRTTMVGAGAPY